MTTKTPSPISVRLEPGQRKALDSIAKVLDRDRSYVINEAVKNYLELHAWQIAHIEEGIRQADTGEFASDTDVAAFYQRA